MGSEMCIRDSYIPGTNPSTIEVNSERALYWLGVGAQPTEQVEAILKLTGDFQKNKGDKNAKNVVKAVEPKAPFVADAGKKAVLKPKAEIKVEAKVEAPVEEAVEAPAEVEAAVEAPVEAAAEEAPAAEAAADAAAE